METSDLAEQADELQDVPEEGHPKESHARMLDEYMGNPQSLSMLEQGMTAMCWPYSKFPNVVLSFKARTLGQARLEQKNGKDADS